MKEIERSELIHDALNFLDDDMIEEVDRKRCNVYANEHCSECKNSNFVQIKRWKNWAALAACIGIIVIISGAWNSISQNDFLHNLNGEMESIENDALNKDEQNNKPDFESNLNQESTTNEDDFTDGNENVNQDLKEESKVELETSEERVENEDTEETEETEETEDTEDTEKIGEPEK